jgi:hypothetical protein
MRRRTLAVFVSVLLLASFASAQFRRLGDTSIDSHLARPQDFDGRFHYCRAVYRANPRGDGGSWLTDYPLADIDLSIRLSELTKIAVAFDAPGSRGISSSGSPMTSCFSARSSSCRRWAGCSSRATMRSGCVRIS